MLFQDRTRRSAQQFQYVKLSLINVGLLSIIGAFSAISRSAQVADVFATGPTFVISLMVVLALLSAVLFCFWLDDAITIAGIDKFLKEAEIEIFESEMEDACFVYRESLNKTKAFQVKKVLFNFGIFLAFSSPPFLIGAFVLMQGLEDAPRWVPYAGMALLLLVLAFPILVWRNFSKDIYG